MAEEKDAPEEECEGVPWREKKERETEMKMEFEGRPAGGCVPDKRDRGQPACLKGRKKYKEGNR